MKRLILLVAALGFGVSASTAQDAPRQGLILTQGSPGGMTQVNGLARVLPGWDTSDVIGRPICSLSGYSPGRADGDRFSRQVYADCARHIRERITETGGTYQYVVCGLTDFLTNRMLSDTEYTAEGGLAMRRSLDYAFRLRSSGMIEPEYIITPCVLVGEEYRGVEVFERRSSASLARSLALTDERVGILEGRADALWADVDRVYESVDANNSDITSNRRNILATGDRLVTLSSRTDGHDRTLRAYGARLGALEARRRWFEVRPIGTLSLNLSDRWDRFETPLRSTTPRATGFDPFVEGTLGFRIPLHPGRLFWLSLEGGGNLAVYEGEHLRELRPGPFGAPLLEIRRTGRWRSLFAQAQLEIEMTRAVALGVFGRWGRHQATFEGAEVISCLDSGVPSPINCNSYSFPWADFDLEEDRWEYGAAINLQVPRAPFLRMSFRISFSDW